MVCTSGTDWFIALRDIIWNNLIDFKFYVFIGIVELECFSTKIFYIILRLGEIYFA